MPGVKYATVGGEKVKASLAGKPKAKKKPAKKQPAKKKAKK